MNIRQAILAAADHIDANPGEFDFSCVTIPSGPGCGTPGCVLGWIGAFMGGCCGEPIILVSRALGANRSFDFYLRMSRLVNDWQPSADLCAKALRLYADKYHPEETTEEFPSIRAELDRIFEAVTC